MRSKVVITLGDPAGCGPEVVLSSLKRINIKNVDFIVVGDEYIFNKYNFFYHLKDKDNIYFIDVRTKGIEKIKFGFPTYINGKASLNYLIFALDILSKYPKKVLVTAPLSKEAVKLTKRDFSGHTEFLAQYFKVKNFVMMMVSQKLKVVLLTRHILLKEIKEYLDYRLISENIKLVYNFFVDRFKINKPHFLFCSVNPHAGINTFLEEEEKIIIRGIRRSGLEEYVSGPLPADSIFTKDILKKYDCIFCAYHDQGMIPFKLLSFLEGVNLTVGLPIIRTSPSHGVAYDLIRAKKVPQYTSMERAIRLAINLL